LAGVGDNGRVAYHRTRTPSREPERPEPDISTLPDERDPLPPAPTKPRPPVATGAKRLLFLVGGLASVAMAYLGALLPGLPTTPWVLLAGYCFSRSSPRLERWLKRSPIFGRLLRDWDEHRGIRRPVKVVAVLMVVTVVSLSVTFGRLPVWVKCVIAGLALVGVCTIVFVVPTIRGEGSGVRGQDRTGG
jgi:uncharacterized membrane protein YbaN (DUF454 family)